MTITIMGAVGKVTTITIIGPAQAAQPAQRAGHIQQEAPADLQTPLQMGQALQAAIPAQAVAVLILLYLQPLLPLQRVRLPALLPQSCSLSSVLSPLGWH